MKYSVLTEAYLCTRIMKKYTEAYYKTFQHSQTSLKKKPQLLHKNSAFVIARA